MPQTTTVSNTDANRNSKMSKTKIWINSLRLFTLPISLAGIIMGTLLAASYGKFSLLVFIFSLLTTACLHLLCNVANDYGDAIRNNDVGDRFGEVYVRYVQDGLLSLQEVKKMIIYLTIASCVFGALMIFFAFGWTIKLPHIIFFALGGFAVYGAIAYTNGKKPYGYKALGDLSVFIFFGIATVAGSFILQTSNFELSILLPAAALGMPIVGLLNNNNIRDLETDIKAGKITIAYKLGLKGARIYQFILLSLTFILSSIYVVLHYSSIFQWLFLLALIPFAKYAIGIYKSKTEVEYRIQENFIPICVLIFSILYGIGFYVGA